jgi:SAM-dependent methyltransferase
MHLNSELLFAAFATKYFSKGQTVLEIGPNGYPSYYNRMVNIEDIQWHTLDIGTEHIVGGEKNPYHIISNSEYNYPIENDTFDVVVSGQVMEHVKNIWRWVDELKRITKKNGLIIIVVPVSWTYHAVPVDCWRIYPDGMRALMEDKKLSVVECTFESLEKGLLPKSTPSIPGDASINLDRNVSGKKRIVFAFNKVMSVIPGLHKFAIPVTVAYDTICVCRKI